MSEKSYSIVWSDAVDGTLRLLLAFGLLWACFELGLIGLSCWRERKLARARSRR